MKKIAVFGYNRLSFEATSRLDTASHEIIVIETDETLATLAEQKGFSSISIDFRDDEALKTLGIGRDIHSIFCFLEDDSKNIFLTLSARALDAKLNIIAVVGAPQSAEKLIAAGADKIIDPYQICGQKIHKLIKKPDITNIIEHTVFGRDDLHIAEVTIPKNSVLENTTSSELAISDQYNLVLIGIVDKELGDDMYFVTGDKDHKLDAGDILVVLGPSREIKAFKKEISHVSTDKI